LQAGDVLLIEVETATGYPIEIEDPVFIAIQTAVSGAGLIVIEAAGNGTASTGRNLDDPLPPQNGLPPTRSLNRALPSFEDSGAIMVSACRSTLTSTGAHRRIAHDGYGSRIDCYAWGKNVATAGGTGLGPSAGPNRSYTKTFDGTSAAAAIVAGGALLVQDMSLESSNGRTRLTPTDMRALFAGRVPGTDILAPSGNQKIGLMPNLQAIAASFAGT
jgi:serine protease